MISKNRMRIPKNNVRLLERNEENLVVHPAISEHPKLILILNSAYWNQKITIRTNLVVLRYLLGKTSFSTIIEISEILATFDLLDMFTQLMKVS